MPSQDENNKPISDGASSVDRKSTLMPRTKDFIEYHSRSDRNVYYRLGIIDFLQLYTNKKKLETKYLRYRFKSKPPNCFSCVDPVTYADRFYDYMSKNLFVSEREFPACEDDSKGNLSLSLSKSPSKKKELKR